MAAQRGGCGPMAAAAEEERRSISASRLQKLRQLSGRISLGASGESSSESPTALTHSPRRLTHFARLCPACSR
eukprot:4379151-Prymnesium_polylepis.1